MPRLSIVIATHGSVDALERTLVSVLENRPPDCEIVVVLNLHYDDPYQLTDEVRYIRIVQGAAWSQCVAAGVKEAKAALVHLLAAGVEVSEGWTEPALRHFGDPHVGSVSPASNNRAQPETRLSQGIESLDVDDLPDGGRRWTASTIWAPNWWAGFYRRAMLLSPAGAFDAALDPSPAALDLAWRQRLANRRAVAEPRSVVIVPAALAEVPTGFAAGYQFARLFWRRRAERANRPSMTKHALGAVWLIVAGLRRPRLWLQLAGKLTAALSLSRFYAEGDRALSEADAARGGESLTPHPHQPHAFGRGAGDRRRQSSAENTLMP